MNTNQSFRLGYIDADAFIRISNTAPGKINLKKLFKVKGADYQRGFELRLHTLSKEAGQA